MEVVQLFVHFVFYFILIIYFLFSGEKTGSRKKRCNARVSCGGGTLSSLQISSNTIFHKKLNFIIIETKFDHASCNAPPATRTKKVVNASYPMIIFNLN